MNKCIIEKCVNNEGTDRFFPFPKDPSVLDKWKRFCQYENINVNTARICWAHFTEDDFDNLVEYEMGSCNELLLKRNACPHVMACSRSYNVHKECEINCSVNEQDNKFLWVEKVVKNDFGKMNHKEKETFSKSVILGLDIFEGYQKELTEPLLEIDSLKMPKPTSDEVVDVTTFNLIQKVGEKIMETKSLEETIEKLRLEKFELVSQIEKSQALWQKRLLIESRTDKNMGSFLTQSQVYKVKNGKDKSHFTDADYEKFLHLYFVSSSAYNLLLHWKYPFPSKRAMQRFIKNKNINGDEFLKVARKQYYSETNIVRNKWKARKLQQAMKILNKTNENNAETLIDDEEQNELNENLGENDSEIANLVPAIEMDSQLNETGTQIQDELKSTNDFKIEPNEASSSIEIENPQNDEDLQIKLNQYFSVID